MDWKKNPNVAHKTVTLHPLSQSFSLGKFSIQNLNKTFNILNVLNMGKIFSYWIEKINVSTIYINFLFKVFLFSFHCSGKIYFSHLYFIVLGAFGKSVKASSRKLNVTIHFYFFYFWKFVQKFFIVFSKLLHWIYLRVMREIRKFFREMKLGEKLWKLIRFKVIRWKFWKNHENSQK